MRRANAAASCVALQIGTWYRAACLKDDDTHATHAADASAWKWHWVAVDGEVMLDVQKEHRLQLLAVAGSVSAHGGGSIWLIQLSV